MNDRTDIPLVSRGGLALESNKVLRQTYMLLSATLLFSAAMAMLSMAIAAPYMGLWMLLPYFLLLFLVEKFKNSGIGILLVFALTGWLGFTLGPILNFYLAVSGSGPIVTALGGTGVIFVGISLYARQPGKDLSSWLPFATIGILSAFVIGLVNIFFLGMSSVAMAVSSMFILASTAMIAWQTNAIVRGGERNYVVATVTLFVMLYNLFISLLSLLGMNRD